MNNVRVFKINSVPLEEVVHPVLGEEYCAQDGSIIRVAALYKDFDKIKSYHILQPTQLSEGYSLFDLIVEDKPEYSNKLLKLFWNLLKNNNKENYTI